MSRQPANPSRGLSLLWVLGGSVIFVVSLLLTAGAKGYRDLELVKQREAELQAELEATEGHIVELEYRLELLRNDPATLERLAREEMGMVGPDDVVFVLPDP